MEQARIIPIKTNVLKGAIAAVDEYFNGVIEVWMNKDDLTKQMIGILSIHGSVIDFDIKISKVTIKFKDFTIKYQDNFPVNLEKKVLELVEKSVTDLKYNYKEETLLEKKIYAVSSNLDVVVTARNEEDLKSIIEKLNITCLDLHAIASQ